jgi:hypothetical protein
MSLQLTLQQVEDYVDRIREEIDRDDCRTCACLQAYIAQLEMDADEDVSHLTEPLKVSRDEMHPSLGCDPCLGGRLFTQYTMETRARV